MRQAGSAESEVGQPIRPGQTGCSPEKSPRRQSPPWHAGWDRVLVVVATGLGCPRGVRRLCPSRMPPVPPARTAASARQASGIRPRRLGVRSHSCRNRSAQSLRGKGQNPVVKAGARPHAGGMQQRVAVSCHGRRCPAPPPPARHRRSQYPGPARRASSQTAGLYQCSPQTTVSSSLKARSWRRRCVSSWVSIRAASAGAGTFPGTSNTGRRTPAVNGAPVPHCLPAAAASGAVAHRLHCLPSGLLPVRPGRSRPVHRTVAPGKPGNRLPGQHSRHTSQPQDRQNFPSKDSCGKMMCPDPASAGLVPAIC